MSLLIKNGCTVDGKNNEKKDILIDGGKIVKLESSISESEATEVIDASGLVVTPGFIDAHTHYHLVSRGTVTADSFEEGSRLAAFGGVTTVVDFADHNKGMNLTDSAEYRLNQMRGKMQIDYSLHQGVYGHGFDDTIPNQLVKLKEMGILTVKIFTTYRETGYLLENEDQISLLFRTCSKLGILPTAHCEYNPVIEQISKNFKGSFTPPDHAVLRPDTAESEAIKIYGELALKENCPFYVVHCSSKKGLEEILNLRKKGAVVYAETTPTYLFLDKSYLEGEYGPLYVMTPPLRGKEDNFRLQKAVCGDEIDVVASDHCTFTLKQKLANPDVRSTYPGVPGTEEMFVLLNSISGISLNRIVDLISVRPAKLFGLYPNKGSFKPGTDADLVILDPNEKWNLTNERVHTHAGYTPYNNFTVKGRVKTTILRGEVIMKDGVYNERKGRGCFVSQKRIQSYGER